jgi:hypothetical protein
MATTYMANYRETRLLALATAFLALCCGCSSTKVVSILAEGWGTGQHQDCIYRGATLYCIPPSLELGTFWSTELDPGVRKPTSRRDTLFTFSFKFVYFIDKDGRKAESDPRADSGTYETRFSGSPEDYSLWDCYKTGAGHPGIECELERKPNAKERIAISKQEQAAALDNTLRSATRTELKKACGEPQKASESGLTASLFFSCTGRISDYMEI